MTMMEDLQKNSEHQKKVENLAKTLKLSGFASSDSQAKKMAEDMLGVEDKVQKRYEELNKKYMHGVKGYKEPEEKQPVPEAPKPEIQKDIISRSPQQEKAYQENVHSLREKAGKREEVVVNNDYEMPNNKPLKDLMPEKTPEPQEQQPAAQEERVHPQPINQEPQPEQTVSQQEQSISIEPDQSQPLREEIVHEKPQLNVQQTVSEEEPVTEEGGDESDIEVTDLEEGEAEEEKVSPEDSSQQDKQQEHESVKEQEPEETVEEQNKEPEPQPEPVRQQPKQEQPENNVDISEIFDFGKK